MTSMGLKSAKKLDAPLTSHIVLDAHVESSSSS